MQNLSDHEESGSTKISPGQKMTKSASGQFFNLTRENTKINSLTRSMSEMSFQCKVKAKSTTIKKLFSSKVSQEIRLSFKRKFSVIDEDDEETKDNHLMLTALKKFEDKQLLK